MLQLESAADVVKAKKWCGLSAICFYPEVCKFIWVCNRLKMKRWHWGEPMLTKVMLGLRLDVALQSGQREIASLYGILQQLFLVCKRTCVLKRVCVWLTLPVWGPLHIVSPNHPDLFCGHPAKIKCFFDTEASRITSAKHRCTTALFIYL